MYISMLNVHNSNMTCLTPLPCTLHYSKRELPSSNSRFNGFKLTAYSPSHQCEAKVSWTVQLHPFHLLHNYYQLTMPDCLRVEGLNLNRWRQTGAVCRGIESQHNMFTLSGQTSPLSNFLSMTSSALS